MTLPSIFITHGGGPCFWLEFPPPIGPNGFKKLESFFDGLLSSLSHRPNSILLVTAHWEASVTTVSNASNPGMLFDYHGFPPHTYQLNYPAPGSPELAARVQFLLAQAQIPVATNDTRGFDHGVFVPMLKIDPMAQIPVAMLSLQRNLDPAYHFRLGEVLAPLRDEGVLIIGSGSSYHNLREFFDGVPKAARVFDQWLVHAVTQSDVDARKQALLGWEAAPSARACHPREEHLIPLMVVIGSGGNSRAQVIFQDEIGGKAVSCFSV